MSTKKQTASGKTGEEVDKLLEAFDSGQDLECYFDFSAAEQPNLKIKRVNIDFPQWMVDRLDAEGARLGVSRQAVVKIWIANRLDAQVS